MIPKPFDATDGERVSGLELESRGNWVPPGNPPPIRTGRMPQVKQRNLFEKANRPVFQKLSEQKSPHDQKRAYYIIFKTHFGCLEAPILVLGNPF